VIRTCIALVGLSIAAAGALAAEGTDVARDPGVLFRESFDDADLLKRGWYDGSKFKIVSDGAYAGKGCIEYRWDAAAKHVASRGMRHGHAPTDQVYVRYYIKLSKGWGWTGRSYHPHLTHFLTTENPKYHGPARSHLTLYIEPVNGKLRLGATDMQNVNKPHGLTQGPLRGGYNGKLYDSKEKVFNDDKWHCVEAFFKLNSLDMAADKPKRDGVIRGWFDGKLVVEKTDIVFRTTDFPKMKWNQFLLTPYFGPGLLPHAQALWIDEMVVARDRVGPLGSKGALPTGNSASAGASAPSGAVAAGTLASRYPGDAGIEKDPAVIFAESFEGGKVPTTGYGKVGGFYDLKGLGKVMDITDKEAATGTHSLELIHTKDVISPQWMHRKFPGVDEVHVRFYRKYAEDWLWPVQGAHDTLIFAGKYANPASADLALYLDITQGPSKRLNKRNWDLERKAELVLKSSFQGPGLDFGHPGAVISHVGWDNYYSMPYNKSPVAPMEGGRWYCFEYMAKMNSAATKKDGEVRLWIDGKLVTEVTGLILRNASHMGIKWDHWMIGPRYGGGNKGPAEMRKNWLDALVVASKRVGPVSKGRPRPKTDAAPRTGSLTPREANGSAVAEHEAGRLLRMARRAERMGQRDVARRLYSQIVKRFGKTESAAVAKKKLSDGGGG